MVVQKQKPVARKPAETGAQTVLVYSKAAVDEIGVETLVGEYVETGSNHGRKVFKRKKRDGDEGIVVFMYYWDDRDGAEFSGWWFGDRVGGAQVWSRCDKDDAMPPSRGWCIPWDGNVVEDLGVEVRRVIAPRGSAVPVKKEAAKEETTEVDDTLSPEDEERVQRASDGVIIAEIDATQTLESVSAMMEGEVDKESLRAVEELIQAQQTALTEAHKVLAAEIMEARKQAPKVVGPLRRLTPRLRSVQASLAHEMANAKQVIVSREQEVNTAVTRESAKAEQKESEKRDTKLFEEALPGLTDLVSQAEDLITVCASSAGPLLDEFKEDLTDAVTAAFEDVEKAANKAQAAVKAARQQVSVRTTAAKQFAPMAQKVALAEYSTLQEKLSDSQKRLNPYLRMQKDHEQKLEAKKATAEADANLAKVEVEVQKLMGSLASPQAGEDDLKAIESVIAPVNSSVNSALKFVEQHIEHAQGKFKEELVQMQVRGKKARARIEEFRTRLKTQAHSLQLNLLLQKSLEKTATAEDLLLEASAAEEPFLRNAIEELSNGEASEALAKCEEVAKRAEAAANQAKTYLKARREDTGRFPESLRETVVEELAQLQLRMEAVFQKVGAFKRETAGRRASLMLTEVIGAVVAAEAQVERASDATSTIAPESIEAAPMDELRTFALSALGAEKIAALACAEARKVLNLKQKEGPGKDASPAYAAELAKLTARLANVAQELQRHRKVALAAEKAWKQKQLLHDMEEETRRVEAEIANLEISTTPLGGDGPSDEEVAEMDAAVTRVQASLTGVVSTVRPTQESAQGQAKALLATLLVRAGKSQKQLNEVAAQTREIRERVQCDRILREARFKLTKVDEAFEKTSEAEAPYLKGLEVMPIEDAARAIAASETAIVEVQQAISEGRSFLATKTLELRKFLDTVARPGLTEIGVLSTKNERFLEKLEEFRNETQRRKSIFLLQEAGATVIAAEEAVQRTILKTAPLASQDVEEMSPEVSQDLCEKLMASEKEAQAKLQETKRLLGERQKDNSGAHDSSELSKLLARLNRAQVDLAKAKAAAGDHEQRFAARMVMSEAEELMEQLNLKIDAVSEASTPLITEGGKSFVVASMTKLVLDALQEHCKRKTLSNEDLFQLISSGKTKVNESGFISFLEKVPALVSRQDLAFSKEQSAAIFAVVDGDHDGFLSSADFQQIFLSRFVCVHGVDITDASDVSMAQTLGKLVVGDIVDAAGEPTTDELLGITRVEMMQRGGGIRGWATVQGKQGTVYLEPLTAYGSFMRELEKSLETAQAASKETSRFVAQKAEELRECRRGPLADAKAALMRMRPQAGVLHAKLDKLRKQIDEGKREHQKREDIEKKKQVEQKDRSLAAAILKAISEKVAEAGEAVAKIAGAAAPLHEAASKPSPHPTATPLTARRNVDAVARDVKVLTAAASDALKSNQARVSKAASGPWAEAKQEMGRLQEVLSGTEARVSKIVEDAETACDTIGSAMLGEASCALRDSLKKRSIGMEALFLELAGKDADGIEEAKITAHLERLKVCKFSPEQTELLFKQVSCQGVVTRHRFAELFERYLVGLKEVAITADFDIKVDSPNGRKLAVGEFGEVLEGPRRDDALGVVRFRIKALADNKEGWVTARGNQGALYMKVCRKPRYFATRPVPMQDSLLKDGAKVLKTLGTHEVIEVLEGPRKESAEISLRAQAKAADGTIGWFTLRNCQGEDTAQPGSSCYVTKSAIALTDGFNIKDKSCQVLRKLEQGETLVCVEGPVQDEAGCERMKVVAKKDGQEGWVSTKGNAGSLYAEQSGRLHVLSKAMPLQAGFESDSVTVKMLDEGTSVELMKGPIEDTPNAVVRVKGKVTSSGQQGWLTMEGDNLKPWGPRYRCVNTTAINDIMDVASEDAKTLRKLEVGETVELLEGPQLEATVGIMRLRGRASRDDTVGWISIAGNQGKQFLKVALEQ